MQAFAAGERIEPAQELLSVGISNVIASFFSSMPIAGSFSRTTVNAMSGAESPAGKYRLSVTLVHFYPEPH